MKAYGDPDNAANDQLEVIGRQGSQLVLDVLAVHMKNVANKFEMGRRERQNIIDSELEAYRKALEF